MPEFEDSLRDVAPAPLRAKAGFAKTHGRPLVVEFPDEEPEEGREPSPTEAPSGATAEYASEE